MKFLPKPSHTSITQIYSGEPILEAYIDTTKNSLNDQLPALFQATKTNLPKKQKIAKNRFVKNRAALTIKPADKNLGIVIMNTSDYIQICASQLADTNTYVQVDTFPATIIHPPKSPEHTN